MPLPELLPSRTDAPMSTETLCTTASRWGIDPVLLQRLQLVSRQVPFPVSIISGARSRELQERLRYEGRPAADYNRSTHAATDANGCFRLATGADVRLGIGVTNAVKAEFGRAAVMSGLRWGGGSPVDPETGIPSDWNHVDLGPR